MSESKYLKYPTEAHGVIPAFQSYEEEAAWWDQADTGALEIEAKMTPVQVRPLQCNAEQTTFGTDDMDLK